MMRKFKSDISLFELSWEDKYPRSYVYRPSERMVAFRKEQEKKRARRK